MNFRRRSGAQDVAIRSCRSRLNEHKTAQDARARTKSQVQRLSGFRLFQNAKRRRMKSSGPTFVARGGMISIGREASLDLASRTPDRSRINLSPGQFGCKNSSGSGRRDHLKPGHARHREDSNMIPDPRSRSRHRPQRSHSRNLHPEFSISVIPREASPQRQRDSSTPPPQRREWCCCVMALLFVAAFVVVGVFYRDDIMFTTGVVSKAIRSSSAKYSASHATVDDTTDYFASLVKLGVVILGILVLKEIFYPTFASCGGIPQYSGPPASQSSTICYAKVVGLCLCGLYWVFAYVIPTNQPNKTNVPPISRIRDHEREQKRQEKEDIRMQKADLQREREAVERQKAILRREQNRLEEERYQAAENKRRELARMNSRGFTSEPPRQAVRSTTVEPLVADEISSTVVDHVNDEQVAWSPTMNDAGYVAWTQKYFQQRPDDRYQRQLEGFFKESEKPDYWEPMDNDLKQWLTAKLAEGQNQTYPNGKLCRWIKEQPHRAICDPQNLEGHLWPKNMCRVLRELPDQGVGWNYRYEVCKYCYPIDHGQF